MAAPAPLVPHRPLAAGEVLDLALSVYKAHFRTFVSYGAILQLPALIPTVLSFLLTGAVEGAGGTISPAAGIAAGFTVIGVSGVVSLITLILRPILAGSMIHTTMSAFYGQSTDLREGLRAGWSRGLPLVVTSLLLIIAVAVAIPLLLIAGLVILAVLTIPIGVAALLLYTLFYHQIIMVENTEYFAALSRSYRLIRGSFWRILGITVVVQIGIAIASIALMAPVLAVLALLAFPEATANMDALIFIAQTLFAATAGILLAPLPTIVTTLAYLDLRMRKEGLDIWLGAQRLAARGQAS